MTTRLPRITAEDFEAFRPLLGRDAKANYTEWLALREAWLGYYPDIVEIDVDPRRFADYLERTNRPYDLNSLLAFAADEP